MSTHLSLSEKSPGSIDAEQIADDLSRLSLELDMLALIEPVTHRSDRSGRAGWIHWETSGATFSAWDVPRRCFDAHQVTARSC